MVLSFKWLQFGNFRTMVQHQHKALELHHQLLYFMACVYSGTAIQQLLNIYVDLVNSSNRLVPSYLYPENIEKILVCITSVVQYFYPNAICTRIRPARHVKSHVPSFGGKYRYHVGSAHCRQPHSTYMIGYFFCVSYPHTEHKISRLSKPYVWMSQWGMSSRLKLVNQRNAPG